MKKEEILEGNKIIAEFMDKKFVGSNGEHIDIEFQGRPLTAHYHTSWDWLLPVYKKLVTQLKKLSSDIKSYKGCSWVSKQATLKHIDDCDCAIRCEIWGVRIIDAFNGIVETIKWYNENKDNKQWLKNSN